MKYLPTIAVAVFCMASAAACSVKEERVVQQPAPVATVVTPVPAGTVVTSQPVPATTTVYTNR